MQRVRFVFNFQSCRCWRESIYSSGEKYRTFLSRKPYLAFFNLCSNNLSEAVLAASVNNTLYALPLTADNGYFLYYNKEYFSEEDIASFERMLDIAAAHGKKV